MMSVAQSSIVIDNKIHSKLNHRYGDDLTFYSIAPLSSPLPNMKKESARPFPLIVDNSINTYSTSEEEDFLFSDNSVEEEEGGALEKREEQYVLPVLHHRPKIRFSNTK